MKKQLIIIRGAQGSGKSSSAAIWANHPHARWYEADQAFEDRNGHYDYDKDLIRMAQAWCYSMVDNALHNPEIERVIVSNTFRKYEHLMPYVLRARELGVDCRILLKFEKFPNEHGVPEDVVQRCREQMEPILGEYICATGSADMDRLVETYPRYKGVYIDTKGNDFFMDGLPIVTKLPTGEEIVP